MTASEIDHDEFNGAMWWLTPEQEEAAQLRSWRIAQAIIASRHLKPRQPPALPPPPTEPAR